MSYQQSEGWEIYDLSIFFIALRNDFLADSFVASQLFHIISHNDVKTSFEISSLLANNIAFFNPVDIITSKSKIISLYEYRFMTSRI